MSEFVLPMGFRFDPTDEELIKFLCLQVNGDPLPSNGIILYKDLYGPNAAPWVVFSSDDVHCYWLNKTEGGDTKSTTFVFTKLIRIANSQRISRTSGGGTWSAQSGPKKIFSSDTGEIIGSMRMLSFKNPADSGGESLDFGHWIMHEYSLTNATAATAADLVVCKITRCVKNPSRSRPPFSPAISDSGSSASKHIPTNKRAAEEYCYPQECKAQKLCGGDGFPAEVAPTSAHVICKEEKPDVAAIGEEEEVEDSWLIYALDHDGNIELPSGDTAEAAKDDSWRASLHQNFDDIVKSCRSSPQAAAPENDPVQESPPSPFAYDFGFDKESNNFLDEFLDLETLWS